VRHPDVHDTDLGAYMGRQYVDSGSPSEKVEDHLGGDGTRISADAFLCDSVISCEGEDRCAWKLRTHFPGDGRIEGRQFLQPPQASDWLSEPIKASLPLSAPASNKTTNSVRYSGTFHVQVGAFMSQADAENRLGMVQQRALDLLDGHLPFTASFMKDDKEWYRARFAGFSKDDAQTTCAALKKLSLECVAMRAE